MNADENQLVRFDWAIKTLLRDKANFDVLEGFLTALLCQEMKIVNILESESNQSDEDKKFNRVDILVLDQKQRYVIIEVQNYHITAYLERILFGVSKLIAETIKPGNDYSEVSKVISISILYFNLGLGDDYVYYGSTDFRGLHNNESLTFRRVIDSSAEKKTFEKLSPRDIFPEYYLINVERFSDAIKNDLDEWIYLLKHSAVRPDFKAKHIDSAREKLAVLKMTPEQRRGYDRYLMEIVNDKDVIQTALNQGLQQGRKEGREEGEKKGREEGEKNASQKMAQKMRETGIDIETIVSVTGLSPEMIEQAGVN